MESSKVVKFNCDLVKFEGDQKVIRSDPSSVCLSLKLNQQSIGKVSDVLPLRIHAEPVVEMISGKAKNYNVKVFLDSNNTNEMTMRLTFDKSADEKSTKKNNAIKKIFCPGKKACQATEKFNFDIILQFFEDFDSRKFSILKPGPIMCEQEIKIENKNEDETEKSPENCIEKLLDDPAIRGAIVIFVYSLLCNAGYKCIQFL